MRPSLTAAVLLALVAAPAFAQSGAWVDLKSDDGRPVANMRAPVELTTEIDRLRGVNAIGSAHPDVTIVEFMDYNCPFCRKAASDLEELARSHPGLRIRFVQNAITSAPSKEAARVDLAAFRIAGARVAYEMHQRLYARHGVNDAATALAIGADLGLDRAKLETVAASDEVTAALDSHMQLAAALGMNATPSFMINGVTIAGYPGPHAMRDIVDSVARCDALAC